MVNDRPPPRMRVHSLFVASAVGLAAALSVGYLSVSRFWGEQVVYGRLHIVWKALGEYQHRTGELPETGHEVPAGPGSRSWRASLAEDVAVLLDQDSLNPGDRPKVQESVGKVRGRTRESCVFAPRGAAATILAICTTNGGWLASDVHNIKGSRSANADPALLLECRSVVVDCYAVEDIRSTPSGLKLIVNGVDRDAPFDLSGARIVRQSGRSEVVPKNLSGSGLHSFLCGTTQE